MKSQRIHKEIKNAHKILIIKIQRTKPFRGPREGSVKLKWTIQQLRDGAGEIHVPQESNDREPPVTSKVHKNGEFVDYESYDMLYELMVLEFSLNQKMRVHLIYKNLGNILTA